MSSPWFSSCGLFCERFWRRDCTCSRQLAKVADMTPTRRGGWVRIACIPLWQQSYGQRRGGVGPSLGSPPSPTSCAPLSTRCWAGLSCCGPAEERTTARALETIERNTKLLSQLIEDVLDVSRIITGKLRLNVAPVELARVLELAADTVRPAADAKDIAVFT